MMLRLAFTLTLALVALSRGEQAKFDGYKLLSFEPLHAEEADILRELRDKYLELDFWLDPVPGRRSKVLVPPSLLSEFKSQLETKGLQYEVLSDDVQGLVDAGSARTPDVAAERRRAQTGDVIDHTNYHSYEKIQDYLTQMSAKYPDNIVLSTLTHATHEGRMVTLVRIKGNGFSGPKPAIIVEAGIHAREWISPAANLYFLEKLLKNYAAGDVTAQQMLDKYDWYMVPVTNPDGYEHSRNSYRMWRKNRRYIRPTCTGVDLNRNFDSRFGTVGVSSNCGSDIYPGERAFTEPETANMRELVYSLQGELVSYLSVHSYSQFLLVPWGNVEYVSRPTNSMELDRVGRLMTDALYQPSGMTYKYGTAWELLRYAASGAAEDWALIYKPGIYAYCYELRPDEYSSTAFLLPASQIVDQGEEYYDSIAVLAQEMRV